MSLAHISERESAYAFNAACGGRDIGGGEIAERPGAAAGQRA